MGFCNSSRICAACEQNGLPFASEKKLVSYKQFRAVRFASAGCKNVFSDVRWPEREGRVMVAAKKSIEVGVGRRLCREQK